MNVDKIFGNQNWDNQNKADLKKDQGMRTSFIDNKNQNSDKIPSKIEETGSFKETLKEVSADKEKNNAKESTSNVKNVGKQIEQLEKKIEVLISKGNNESQVPVEELKAMLFQIKDLLKNIKESEKTVLLSIDDKTVGMMRKAGYGAALTTDPGITDLKESPFRMKRVIVENGDTLEDFIKKVTSEN